MRKIYIITIDEVYDFEKFAHTPQAFVTSTEAMEEFERIVKNGKEMAEAEGYECDEGAFEASFYKDGEWPQYHYDVKLHAVEPK